MPIRFQYDAAAVVPPKQNELKKYGGPLVMQQRKYDMGIQQQELGQANAMQRLQASPGYLRETHRQNMMNDMMQGVADNEFEPADIRSINAINAGISEENLRGFNERQRDQAVAQAYDRLSRIALNRRAPVVPRASQPQSAPMTAQEAFKANPKEFDRYTSMIEAELKESGEKYTYEDVLRKAGERYDQTQAFLSGQPQGQPQPNAPAGPQASTAPAAAPSAAPATAPASPVAQSPAKQGSRGYISIAPGGGRTASQQAGQASGGWKPTGTAVYSPDGKFLGDPRLYDEAGAQYIRGQAAPPASQAPATQYLPDGTPYNVNLADMTYDAANPERSAGTNYFNPENPEYARMRGADPAIINPPQNVGQFKGRYGLGGMDYGINPATGNRVTASVRPGGGLEYDEPTGGPRGKGGVTIMGGKKKPAPAAEVSPGGTPVNAGLEPTAPVRISRDDWRVKWAEVIAANPDASMEHKGMAADILKNAGLSEGEVAAMEAKGTTVQSEQASAEGSYRPSSGDMWGNPNRQPSSEKKSPAWGSQKDVLEIPGQIYGDISAQAKETQKRVGEVMQDRDIDNRQRAKSLMTGLPPSKDQEIADSLRESIETQRKNPRIKPASPPTSPPASPPTSPSLLGQLEQAESASAGSVPPSPASGATQGQEELRTWTSVDGKTFDGSIVEGSLEAAAKQPIGQQVITVKTKSGKVFNVPIERFSEEDRAFMEAKYKINFQLDYTDKNDPELKYLKIAPGKAEMQSKVKMGGKYNQKTGPRSEQYQTPGPFNDSIPKEFYTPPSYLERNRNRVN